MKSESVCYCLYPIIKIWSVDIASAHGLGLQ